MTFKPTKARQKRWIKDYLNGGVCLKTKEEDRLVRLNLPLAVPMPACYEALEWLAYTDIKTLAEAWDQCERPDWMFWMLARMHPTKEDDRLVRVLYTELVKRRWVPVSFRAAVRRDLHSDVNLEMRTVVGWFDWACTRVIGDDTMLNRAQQAKTADLMRKVWGNPWRLK